VGLIQDLYEGARTLVRMSVGETEMFPVTVGLHQGSSLSPYIFYIIMEELGRGIIEPAPWDLLFVNNIVIISTTREGLQQKSERCRRALEDRGLKISRRKTEYMVFNGGYESGDVCLLQEKLKKVNTFKYLGFHVASKGSLDPEITIGYNWDGKNGRMCLVFYVTKRSVQE